MLYPMRPWKRQSTALYVSATGVVAACLALMVACSAFAGNGVMLQIKDAPLKEVVMMLTQQSGINIYIADDSKLERKVTVSFTDVPLEKALDYVVKGAGISYKKMEDGTYVIGGSVADDAAVVPPPSTLAPVEPVYAPEPPKVKVESIKLMHSKPSELLTLMGWNGTNPMLNCEASYPDRSNVGGSRIKPSPGTTQILNGQTGETVPVGGSGILPSNQPVAPTIDPRAMNSGAGRAADPTAGAGQVPGPPGGSPRYPQTNQTNQTNRPGGTNNQNFLWPEGIQNAVPFDLDNSVIVMGDEQGIQDFKNIVRMLDVPPKQVQVKAEFVEVKTDDVKSFGIDWSLDKLNESFSAALSGGTGNVVVGFATGNLTATLRAQLTEDVGRIINSPIISTINNQNAYISISNQIPYWTTYNIVTGTGQILEQPQMNQISIDTHLDVLPRVNGDGTITMILRPGVADTGNVVTGPDGTQVPETRTQELFTQRRVANGETIVVGGFIRKNDSSSVTKVPVLGDLPIVGSLFRGTSKTTEDRELLIFVTPTIIPDTGGGTMGAGSNLVP
jgi:general secretion pathway protein D